ncbi:methyl-accepting chemotaxis protein [Pseudomonas brassicae]|uniref:methyl-accepting chemotaxis protein n=1 Tax=Pseudomonas brassicae TaxID=2708063 RepID=UPI003B75B6FE
MNSWFANISVNLKLALGFGLVLLLTGLLALTGWTSLGGLIDRSNWMSDITQLNNELTELRVARLQYMIADATTRPPPTCRSSSMPSWPSSRSCSTPSRARTTSSCCVSRSKWSRPTRCR